MCKRHDCQTKLSKKTIFFGNQLPTRQNLNTSCCDICVCSVFFPISFWLKLFLKIAWSVRRKMCHSQTKWRKQNKIITKYKYINTRHNRINTNQNINRKMNVNNNTRHTISLSQFIFQYFSAFFVVVVVLFLLYRSCFRCSVQF